jgi:F0F1-type ATP synthase epsilon subunit
MALTAAGTYQASQTGSTGGEGLKRFKVKISSPYQTYFEGEAVSLSATNSSGAFDILAGHINFFSLLVSGQVVINTGYQRLEFPLSRGIIRVERDFVTVFADV